MKRPLSSSLRTRKSLRNRKTRTARRVLLAAMIEMFRSDDRLIPPPWLWAEVYGQQVLEPAALVKLTGV